MTTIASRRLRKELVEINSVEGCPVGVSMAHMPLVSLALTPTLA